jgi:hypothetical protein
MIKELGAKGNIQDDTEIMPDIVASTVMGELEDYLSTSKKFGPYEQGTANKLVKHIQQHGETYVDELVKKTETLYQVNADFKRKLNSNARAGNAGRDYLYMFMRHWLSSILLRNFPGCRSVVPQSFMSGKPLPR